MSAPPFLAKWDGETFMPLPRFMAKCQTYFRPGLTYSITEQVERSAASHSHYFACVNEAFHNLPEEWSGQFATVESLRKWALIRAGFCDQQHIVLSTHEDAEKVGNHLRGLRDYAEVSVVDRTVVILIAQSQSKKAMGPARFQESKTKVLDILSYMIGVDVADLSKQAKSAA